jgi:hypothetical protein
MKRVTLVVRQSDIARRFPHGWELLLKDDASILDAINEVDAEIAKESNEFPVKAFRSLLQMVYHPHEHRFYKQVALQASVKSNQFLGIRENPDAVLPDGTTVVLIPEGGCSTDWEEPVK